MQHRRYWIRSTWLLSWVFSPLGYALTWQSFIYTVPAGGSTVSLSPGPYGQYEQLFTWPSGVGDPTNYGPTTDLFTPVPGSPDTLYWGMAQFSAAGGAGWIRAGMLVPPAEPYPSPQPPQRTLNTYPQLQAGDINQNFQIIGSQFIETATMCQGVLAPVTWTESNSTGPTSIALPSSGQPFRVGVNLTSTGPSEIMEGWVCAGPASTATTWSQLAQPGWTSTNWNGIDGFFLGGASTSQFSTGTPPFVFTSLFFATVGATLIYNSSAVTLNAVQNDANNDWLLYNGGLTVQNGGLLNLTGVDGLLEVFNNLTVQNGGSIQNLGNAVFSGPNVLISNSGTMNTGETYIESANCRLTKGTLQVSPTNASADHIYGLFLEGGSVTTIGSGTEILVNPNAQPSGGQVLIKPKATLAGLGTLTATVGIASEGLIAPGDGFRLGTLTFNNSPLTLTSNSEIYAQTFPDSNDQLNVTSSVVRSGKFVANMLKTPGEVYIEGDRYVLFNANSVSGGWGALYIASGAILSPFLSARLIDANTQVILEIFRSRSYASTAHCPLQLNVACNLDAARVSDCTCPQLLNALYTTVDYFTEQQLDCGCVWDLLSGAEYADQMLSGAEIGYGLNRVLQSEIWRAQDAWVLPASHRANRGWVSGFMWQQHYWDSLDAVFPMHNHERGVLIGADFTVGPKWVVGAAFHAAGANSSWAGLSGVSSIQDYGGSAYAGWSRPDRYVLRGWTWYTTASASAGYTSSSMHRTPLCDMCTDSTANGLLLAGRLEGGARIDCASALVQPYLALQGSYWGRQSFCESVVGPALGLDDHRANEWLSCITPGIRCSTVMNTPTGMRFSPEAIFEINQYLSGRAPEVQLAFEGGPCTYTAFNSMIPSQTLTFGVGGELMVTPRLLIQLRAQAEVCPGFSSLGGSLEVNYRF